LRLVSCELPAQRGEYLLEISLAKRRCLTGSKAACT